MLIICGVAKYFLLGFLVALFINAGPNAYAAPCALDEVFLDNACRPFTNAECTSRYGNVSSFDPSHGRCVWRLPDGAEILPPQGLTGADHCVLPRRLHSMLTTARPGGGMALIPTAPDGAVVEQLLCGRVDLRPWSSAALPPVPAREAVVTAAGSQSALWLAVSLFVLLGLAVLILLGAVAWFGRKIWRNGLGGHTSSTPRESAPDTARPTPCEKAEERDERPGMG